MQNNDLEYLKKIVELEVLTQYCYLRDGENYIEKDYQHEEYQKAPETFKRTYYELALLQSKSDLLKFTKQEQIYLKKIYTNSIKANFIYKFYNLLGNNKSENFEENINLIKYFYKNLDVCLKQLHNELKNNNNVKISEIFLYFFSLQKITDNANAYLKKQMDIYDINNQNIYVQMPNDIDIVKEKENLDKIKSLILKNNQEINS